jgi:hypothetical protein
MALLGKREDMKNPTTPQAKPTKPIIRLKGRKSSKD